MDKVKISIRMDTLLYDSIKKLQKIYLFRVGVDISDHKISNQTILLKLLIKGIAVTFDETMELVSSSDEKKKLKNLKNNLLQQYCGDSEKLQQFVRSFYVTEEMYSVIQTLLRIENVLLGQGLTVHNLTKGMLVHGIGYYIHILRTLLDSGLVEEDLKKRFLIELDLINKIVGKYE